MSITLNGTSQTVTFALDTTQSIDSDHGVFLEWESGATNNNGYLIGIQDSTPSPKTRNGTYMNVDNDAFSPISFDDGTTAFAASGVGTWTANTTYRLVLLYNSTTNIATCYVDSSSTSVSTNNTAVTGTLDEIMLGARTENTGDTEYELGTWKKAAYWSTFPTADLADLLENGKDPDHPDVATPTQYYPLLNNYEPAIGTAVGSGPAFPAVSRMPSRRSRFYEGL